MGNGGEGLEKKKWEMEGENNLGGIIQPQFASLLYGTY